MLDRFALNLTGAPADWNGRYAGISAGYAGNSAFYCDGSDGDVYDCGAPDAGLPTPQANGAMLGVTAGQNWQYDQFVYGVIGDVMAGNLQDVVSDTTFPSYECGNGCGLEVTAIAMLRGRVGYAMGDALPYASAGFALTKARVFEPDTTHDDGVFINPVIGLGVDYQMSDTIVAGVEVLQFLEARDDVTNNGFCAGCAATAYTATMIRGTVAYQF